MKTTPNVLEDLRRVTESVNAPCLVNVDGGGVKPNTLIVDDSASLSNAYSISDTAVTRTAGPVSITFSAISAIALTTGDGGDTITVLNTAATPTVSVDAGNGDDTVIVGAGTLDNSRGPLTVNPGLGIDTLKVDDSGDSDDNSYTWTCDFGYTSPEALEIALIDLHRSVQYWATGNLFFGPVRLAGVPQRRWRRPLTGA